MLSTHTHSVLCRTLHTLLCSVQKDWYWNKGHICICVHFPPRFVWSGFVHAAPLWYSFHVFPCAWVQGQTEFKYLTSVVPVQQNWSRSLNFLLPSEWVVVVHIQLTASTQTAAVWTKPFTLPPWSATDGERDGKGGVFSLGCFATELLCSLWC